ncbi:MAG: hypothetical protein M3N12_04040, partial [Verrucomicrobiota bacterium]|nr:hypothetical protein [Verrucomicrobiota bacterium]
RGMFDRCQAGEIGIFRNHAHNDGGFAFGQERRTDFVKDRTYRIDICGPFLHRDLFPWLALAACKSGCRSPRQKVWQGCRLHGVNKIRDHFYTLLIISCRFGEKSICLSAKVWRRKQPTLLVGDPNNAVYSRNIAAYQNKLGDVLARSGANKNARVMERLSVWLEARSSYEKAQQMFSDLQAQGTLSPADAAEQPKEFARRMSECEEAIKQLTAATGSH